MIKPIKNYYYETVTEAIKGLEERGYTSDFQILAHAECLVCQKSTVQLSPEEFRIDETHRFEGSSDPGDEMIVFAISSPHLGIKGIVVNAYGMYEDSANSAIVNSLLRKVISREPIKRHSSLKSLSREHHHGLLLCWKIRTGLKKDVITHRIKSYTDWFYKTYLQEHFDIEEKYVYSVLGEDHRLISKALSQHRRLRRLFESDKDIRKKLYLIEEELEKHIRFEERNLFNEVQKLASAEQLHLINKHHHETKFIENNKDLFWE